MTDFTITGICTTRRGRFPVAPKADRTLDGITFASKGEARRYAELRLLERAGRISGLTLQPTYTIKIKGERFCQYRPDFQYLKDGVHLVIEDVKSSGTQKDTAYRLRKRAFELEFNLVVTEVRA